MTYPREFLQHADEAYTALRQYYESGFEETASGIQAGGHPATAARIRKPCRDLLNNWRSFIDPLRNSSHFTDEHIEKIVGFTDAMKGFLHHVVEDEVFVETSKQEEDQLRSDIKQLITTIRDLLGAYKAGLIPASDVQYFEELAECQHIETFGGLENLRLRLTVFLETHFR